jgi:hypothetical protein
MVAQYSAYDVPRNNMPCVPTPRTENVQGGGQVVDTPSAPTVGSGERERKISLREQLAKKNSAPEILFPNKSLSTEENLSAIFNSVHIPPRPHKKPSLGVADEHGMILQQCSYTNSAEIERSPEPDPNSIKVPEPEASEENTVGADDNSFEGQTLLPTPGFSPTMSAKSMDIDNLDVLSELSDVQSNHSETPPDTPQAVIAEPEPEVESYYSLPPVETEDEEEMESIYENIKYATVSTILTELETVCDVTYNAGIQTYILSMSRTFAKCLVLFRI